MTDLTDLTELAALDAKIIVYGWSRAFKAQWLELTGNQSARAEILAALSERDALRAEVERLEKESGGYRAQVFLLGQEVERLRAALAPFAKAVERAHPNHKTQCVFVDDLRTARAAIKGGDHE